MDKRMLLLSALTALILLPGLALAQGSVQPQDSDRISGQQRRLCVACRRDRRALPFAAHRLGRRQVGQEVGVPGSQRDLAARFNC